MQTIKSIISNSVQFDATNMKKSISKEKMCDAIAAPVASVAPVAVTAESKDNVTVVVKFDGVAKYAITTSHLAFCPKKDHLIAKWNAPNGPWLKITPNSAIVFEMDAPQEGDAAVTIDDNGKIEPTPVNVKSVCDLTTQACGAKPA
jgi:hypothetical protein